MIDYAQVKVIEEKQVQSQATIKTLTISPFYLFLTLSVAILIYLITYQNMSIAQTEHQINQKKVMLHSLVLRQQSLIKAKYQYTNTNRIIVGCPINGISSCVQIVH